MTYTQGASGRLRCRRAVSQRLTGRSQSPGGFARDCDVDARYHNGASPSRYCVSINLTRQYSSVNDIRNTKCKIVVQIRNFFWFVWKTLKKTRYSLRI